MMSFESFFKTKKALPEKVIIEDLKGVLDEAIFWVHMQNSLKILQPIVSAITR